MSNASDETVEKGPWLPLLLVGHVPAASERFQRTFVQVGSSAAAVEILRLHAPMLVEAVLNARHAGAGATARTAGLGLSCEQVAELMRRNNEELFRTIVGHPPRGHS